jgi:hypothetical protein
LRIDLAGAGRQSLFTTIISHELGQTAQAARVAVLDQFAPQLAGIAAACSAALEELGLIRVELAARARAATRLLLRPGGSLKECADRRAVQADRSRESAPAHAAWMALPHPFLARAALLVSLLLALVGLAWLGR